MKVIKVHKMDLSENMGVLGEFENYWQIFEIVYTFPEFWVKNKITLGVRMGNLKIVLRGGFKPWNFIV